MSDHRRALEYTLSFPEPWTHRVEVTLRIPEGGTIELWMPVWTPGSYLVREYSRHVQDLTAHSESGAELAVLKTRKNGWAISASSAKHIIVRYTVYGRELSVRTNWIDDTFALLNGAPTFLAVRGLESASHRVTLDLPKNWKGAWSAMATTAKAGSEITFEAANHDELIDSPILAGTPEVHDIPVDKIPISLLNTGDPSLWDGAKAASHVQTIVERYRTMMGGLPFDRYFFLNCIVESRGGLEHANSCVLMTSRYAYRKRASYVEWLGLVSHEFFHVWNVKRLRPQELGPWDFTRPLATRGLWVAEGFTNYYGHLMLRRAGLWDEREFLRRAAETIRGIESAQGSRLMSAEESSLSAPFLDDAPHAQLTNLRNTAISYYPKGELIGMVMDLLVRGRTKGKTSLDDIMRDMYEEFYLKSPNSSYYLRGRGYQTDDLERVASRRAGFDLSDFFKRHIRDVEVLPYEEAFAYVGLRLVKTQSEEPYDAGVSLQFDDPREVRIENVRNNSPAEDAGLQANDQIVLLNGQAVTRDSWRRTLARFKRGDSVPVTVKRDRRTIKANIVLGQPERFDYRIEEKTDATPEQKQLRAAWLTGK
jgi:predicted metalloprotease with PDZ domain